MAGSGRGLSDGESDSSCESSSSSSRRCSYVVDFVATEKIQAMLGSINRDLSPDGTVMASQIGLAVWT